MSDGATKKARHVALIALAMAEMCIVSLLFVLLTDRTQLFRFHKTYQPRTPGQLQAVNAVYAMLPSIHMRADELVLTSVDQDGPAGYQVRFEAIPERYVYGSHYTFYVVDGTVTRHHGGK